MKKYSVRFKNDLKIALVLLGILSSFFGLFEYAHFLKYQRRTWENIKKIEKALGVLQLEYMHTPLPSRSDLTEKHIYICLSALMNCLTGEHKFNIIDLTSKNDMYVLSDINLTSSPRLLEGDSLDQAAA